LPNSQYLLIILSDSELCLSAAKRLNLVIDAYRHYVHQILSLQMLMQAFLSQLISWIVIDS